MEGPAGTTICPEVTSFHQSWRWPRQAGIVCIVREYLVGGGTCVQIPGGILSQCTFPTVCAHVRDVCMCVRV